MTDLTLEELSDALKVVGFHTDVDAQIGGGINARRWNSDYAHVYVVDAAATSSEQWPTFVNEIDRVVLNGLRSDELKNGGVVDAHVCFLIDDLKRREIEGVVDERVSRNVSRKYWIGRGEGFTGFQSRLSLLGLGQLANLSAEATFGISPADQKWVDMLVEEGPEAIFQRLIAELGAG